MKRRPGRACRDLPGAIRVPIPSPWNQPRWSPKPSPPLANRVLPDSSVYIGALRAGRDPFKTFAQGIVDREWEFATCGMVMLEVGRGLREPALLQRFRERFTVMIFLPTTSQVWERATHPAWSLDRQGKTLPARDLLIAACALNAGAAVLAADAHFHCIPGLHVLKSLDS